MTVQPPLSPEVQAGAAYLDEAHPGWYYLIDITDLDIGHPYDCILGQLDCTSTDDTPYVGYSHYLLERGKSPQWAAEHGFSIPAQERMFGRIQLRIDQLNAEWKRLIAYRRGYTSLEAVESALAVSARGFFSCH